MSPMQLFLLVASIARNLVDDVLLLILRQVAAVPCFLEAHSTDKLHFDIEPIIMIVGVEDFRDRN